MVISNLINIIKWIGTICVILAAVCRSIDLHLADVILSIVGAAAWAYVAIKVKDKALLTVNAFIGGILLLGVLK